MLEKKSLPVDALNAYSLHIVTDLCRPYLSVLLGCDSPEETLSFLGKEDSPLPSTVHNQFSCLPLTIN